MPILHLSENREIKSFRSHFSLLIWPFVLFGTGSLAPPAGLELGSLGLSAFFRSCESFVLEFGSLESFWSSFLGYYPPF